jgi:hypothetical protein
MPRRLRTGMADGPPVWLISYRVEGVTSVPTLLLDECEATSAASAGIFYDQPRNTNQFNPQFLLRGHRTVQQHEAPMLGEGLALYELVPGTVVHAGTGLSSRASSPEVGQKCETLLRE